MPRQKKAFLIQCPDGTYRTVQAESIVGAAKEFVNNYAVAPGATFFVKEREGSGDWVGYSA